MLFPKKVKFRKWHTMRRNAKKGIASLCIGGGEATALAVEML